MKAKTLGPIALSLALLAASLLAPNAQAAFGIHDFDLRFTDENGAPSVQAGSHPFALETYFEMNHHETEPGVFEVDGGDIRDAVFEMAKGFIGDATAVPRCSTLEFASDSCADNTAVGVTAAQVQRPSEAVVGSIHNLTPPPGVPLRLGFILEDVPLVIDASLKHSPDYNVSAAVRNAPQPLTVFGSVVQLWGVPADPAHDFARGDCVDTSYNSLTTVIVDGRLNLQKREDGPECSAGEAPEKPLLTLPRSCQGPLATRYELSSWSGSFAAGSLPMAPLQGCDQLPFDPEISARATTDSAAGSSGLDFELDFEDELSPGSEGLIDPDGIAASEMKEIVVTLPEGVTVNPSIAEGLGVCTPADLDRETLAAAPGEGCPNASKIGSVTVQTPLVDEPIEGSVFLAQQNDPESPGAENPFGTDIALYIVLKNKNLGVLVKQAGKVEPDPRTGQLVSTFSDVPQIPFFRLRFHFREGQRAPLIAPPACGAHTTVARLTPWARPNETLTRTASFEIVRGVAGGPCPAPGAPPFAPGFRAGSLNNAAGSFSPFLMRLTRADGEQDITKFSALLPPGVLGKLAGVAKCPDAQIALARARSGRAELRSPSCPAASRIGATLAGAGVGSSLTYVPGSLYLAGPYNGAPLSVAAVTPAVAGPFDVGTVVVRVALDLDPKTAEVQVDGAASDPIPHILRGIPLKMRELRVDVDRPGFTLNPTSCQESSTRATVFGSFLDQLNPADDRPLSLAARFQAASCASLGFKPKLAIELKGGTRRGAHPALRAVVIPRPGDANFSRAAVTLPRSAFLDQGHIRTICTRVQFAAGAGNGAQCPAGARYGFARAWSPLLDEPLAGPVFLRSSDNNLPDLVVALRGLVDVELSARIDSVKGGIRSTFAAIPDAPVSRFILEMQGGKKGLIVNSRNLCAGRHRAKARLVGQNGRRATPRLFVRALGCGKARGKGNKRGSRAG